MFAKRAVIPRPRQFPGELIVTNRLGIHRIRGVCPLGILAAALTLLAAPLQAQIVLSEVGGGILRADASPADLASAPPSISLAEPRPPLSAFAGDAPVPIAFDRSGGLTTVTVGRTPGDSVYGTGLVPGPLERTGRRTRLFNTDAFGWGDNAPSLYQSHPWVLMVHADGSATGVHFDTTFPAWIEVTDTAIEVEVQGNQPALPVPVYLIDRPTPEGVLQGLADLTGLPFLPPLWSLGYHQSRYSYDPDDRVLEIAGEFRDRDLPADVIWLDIDYMDGFRAFTWDPVDFPDPGGLDASLDAMGFQTIAIVDPHIKVDPGYTVYQSGQANDVWVVRADGVTPYTGDVWPGLSAFPDYTRADVRAWWASWYPEFVADGIDGIWNDMNEPAVFNSPGGTMPLSNIHRADPELGGIDSHARYHNVYGMLMARATREGLLLARPNERPFVLTRANHLGGHRYAATWTGDNSSDWYHLDVSIQNVLNLGLSGQPNAGPDIGGFVGANSGEHFARWMGFGALLPFARGHTGTGNPDKEPWVFGDDIEQQNRIALQRRYRLLPHIYTLFEEAHRTGVPVARPLFFADPSDPALRTLDDAFLLGDSVVVSAATSPGAQPERPPLAGPLYRFGFPATEDAAAASDICVPNQPDLYLRAGHIVPTGPILQHTADGYLSELTLLVALDEDGQATGTLYEDDGLTFDYRQGDFLRTTYRAVRTGDTVTLSVAGTEGNRPRPARPLTVRLFLADGFEVSTTGVDGAPLTLTIPGTIPDVFECPPEPPVPARVIDGRRIPEAFDATDRRATQTRPTFDDNITELNELFVAPETAGVRIGLTGNLAQDGTALVLLIDSVAGGQNTLDTTGNDPPPAGLLQLTGTTLDTGFAPDRMLWINAFGGGLFVDLLTLQANQPATKRYIGQNTVNSGSGTLVGGDNPEGIRLALDNTNTLGITGTTATDPSSASTGFEAIIPWETLGLTPGACGGLGVQASVVFTSGQWSGQSLPPIPVGVVLPVAPAFPNVAGDQFVRLPYGSPADLAEPYGSLTFADITAFLDAFTDKDPRADLASPPGVYTFADIAAFLDAFVRGCP